MNKRMIAILLLTLLTTGVLAAIRTLRATTQSKDTTVKKQSQSIRQGAILSGTGSIEGYVHNAEGQPVAGAEVSLQSVDKIIGILPLTETDEQGKFIISNVPPGVYRVNGEHRKESFPYASTGVDHTVYADQVTPGVTINLGSKAAKLIGRVVEAVTSKPVKNPRVTLRREDSNDFFYMSTFGIKGEFEILVPTFPFTIEVSRPGHKKSFYKEAGSKKLSDALRLAPSEIKHMDIILSPDK